MDVGDKVKLEPCPFCGSTDIGHQTFDEDDSRDFVMCNGCGVFAQRNDCEAEPVEVWNRRTPSASTGKDGLPELPKMDGVCDIPYAQNTPADWDEDYRDTWQQLQVAHRNKMQWRAYALDLRAQLERQYAREAVAADRQSNSRQMTVKQQAHAGAELGVKTWQERIGKGAPVEHAKFAMMDEIADLRAQLARQSRGEAVGVIVGNDPVHGWHMKALKPWDEIGAGTKLYAAPPLSSEPQGDA